MALKFTTEAVLDWEETNGVSIGSLVVDPSLTNVVKLTQLGYAVETRSEASAIVDSQLDSGKKLIDIFSDLVHASVKYTAAGDEGADLIIEGIKLALKERLDMARKKFEEVSTGANAAAPVAESIPTVSETTPAVIETAPTTV